MQLHPYRTEIPEAPSCAHPCALCVLREKLARVPLRTVVTGALAATFLFLNATAAASSFESLRLTRKMFANASAITPAPRGEARQSAPKVSPELTVTRPPSDQALAPAEPLYVRLSANEYLVSRPAIDEALEEVASMLPRMYRPSDEDAPLVVSHLVPTMSLARLGLRNGDGILAVNGLPLISREMTIEAFYSLEKASDLLLEVARDGKLRKVAVHLI